jgi:hypothetical protein
MLLSWSRVEYDNYLLLRCEQHAIRGVQIQGLEYVVSMSRCLDPFCKPWLVSSFGSVDLLRQHREHWPHPGVGIASLDLRCTFAKFAK